jgi:hypothetical protein
MYVVASGKNEAHSVLSPFLPNGNKVNVSLPATYDSRDASWPRRHSRRRGTRPAFAAQVP